MKEGKQNKLRACDIKRITDTIVAHADVDKYARVVGIDEIRGNDYNLNIPRYVDSSQATETWDIYASMVPTYKDKDVRQAVALSKAKAETPEEAMADPQKSEVFYRWMDASKVDMAETVDASGEKERGIEDFVPNSQYLASEHRDCVVRDICDTWPVLSRDGRFHAYEVVRRNRNARV